MGTKNERKSINATKQDSEKPAVEEEEREKEEEEEEGG